MDAVLRSGADGHAPGTSADPIAAERHHASRPPRGALVGLLALYGCWGSSIPAMKLMVAGIPPLAGAAAVFLVGGLVLGVIGRHGTRPTAAQLRQAMLVGVLLLVGGQGLATVVLTKLSASLTALLTATIPLWMAALRVRRRRHLDRGALVRLAVGFGGVVVILVTAPGAAFGGSLPAIAVCMLATLSWAIGSIRSGEADTLPADPRVASAIELVTGGCALLLLAGVSGQLAPHAYAHVGASSIAAAGYLLLVDSLAGFALYGWLLRRAPVDVVGSYAYVTPLVAAAIGIGVFGDHAWPGMLLGAALVLSAVYAQVRTLGAKRPG